MKLIPKYQRPYSRFKRPANLLNLDIDNKSDTVPLSVALTKQRIGEQKRRTAAQDAQRQIKRQDKKRVSKNVPRTGRTHIIPSRTNPDEVTISHEEIGLPQPVFEQRSINPDIRNEEEYRLIRQNHYNNQELLNRFHNEVVPVTMDFMGRFFPSTIVGAIGDKNKSFIGSMVEGNRGLGEISDNLDGVAPNLVFDVVSPAVVSKGLNLFGKAINSPLGRYLTTVKTPRMNNGYTRLGPLEFKFGKWRPSGLSPNDGVLFTGQLPTMRMRVADFEDVLRSRGITDDWIDFGRNRYSSRFSKNGEFIEGTQSDFDDMFDHVNFRLETRGQLPISLSELISPHQVSPEVPLSTPKVTSTRINDPISDLISGIDNDRLPISTVADRLSSEIGRPVTVKDINKAFRTQGKRLDPELIRYNPNDPNLSVFDTSQVTQLYLADNLNRYYDYLRGKQVRTRDLSEYYRRLRRGEGIGDLAPEQLPFTEEEISRMFTPEGTLKEEYALDYLYPGDHGQSNWYDSSLSASLRMKSYLRTRLRTPVTPLFDVDDGSIIRGIGLSGEHPYGKMMRYRDPKTGKPYIFVTGKTMTPLSDMREARFMNPSLRSGVITLNSDGMDWAFSANSIESLINLLGSEIKSGRRIYSINNPFDTTPIHLNNLALTGRYKWDFLDEDALNMFRRNPKLIDRVKGIEDKANKTVEMTYDGSLIGSGTQRTKLEWVDLLNSKLITPFNKNYGSELRLSDFTLDGNHIIAPPELASKVLYKKGGRLFK